MRNIVKSFVMATTLIAVAAPSALAAGGFVNAKVTSISVQGTQSAVIGLSAIGGSRPSCATGGLGMVVDLNTPKGRAALSLAQTALLADLTVTGSGTGSCTSVPASFENLNALVAQR